MMKLLTRTYRFIADNEISRASNADYQFYMFNKNMGLSFEVIKGHQHRSKLLKICLISGGWIQRKTGFSSGCSDRKIEEFIEPIG